MFRPSTTSEIDRAFDMQVVDLAAAMAPFWKGPEPYPGNPYNHNAFRARYSDHHPVFFQLHPRPDDDQFGNVARTNPIPVQY